MQHIYKIFFLNYNRISFYKIFTILINSMITFTIFSGCNILLKHENLLVKKNKINSSHEKINNNYVDFIKKYNHQIYKGEKLNTILIESGVKMHEILKLLKTDSTLKNLKTGEHLFWKVNNYGELLELRWIISNFQKKTYKKNHQYFLKKNILKKNVLIKKIVLIKKNSNFFNSAFQSGLNLYEINSVIKAMEWQVDFKKLNTGSYFNLVFLHHPSKNTNILIGAKLNNFKKKYYSIRASNGNFYNINGFTKTNNFINCSFLKKYRISSNFNLNRLHPVTHHITPHLGVDLAMPEGTPILSTMNGKVIKAYFDKIAGFYIALQNTNQYVTRYLHLKKILVKVGDDIKIGQKIAFSGNTGRTTGPHLHYEIWINNHAVDPINSHLIFCEELTEKQKENYIKKSRKILRYLQ